MSRTFKVVTVVGTSAGSIEDAVQSAVADASGTLRNLGWFEVREIRGRIESGGVLEYQVTVDIGFRIESE